MNDFAQAGFDPASSPQVRTLLLTDLCDSTLLVERLGDTPAAELFRAHDRLVLELQQRWRGRLIDRSDGLLLLFERPVDGLGFALDYTRGLRELGDRPEVRDRKLQLQARAGLHVGEVLTWQNSEAAVQAGAKPLEVEGLAKPLAGRLMALARPGQILLSATAEPLARRAARELGERSEHLIWKSHGRWRFKGVPDGQEVFEVGEPGYAPLRAPKQNGGKAWRDIPVWRRPAALAAELFLVAGLATGAWFLTRPTPAIAFNERDWVVVGDLRNLTGEPVLDESLQQAFRISLEQSRYVNVLSDLKVRDTLALMKRGPSTVLDRTVASEVAIRDGARAVILPTVAEVGGRIRVSAEVIDPNTQTTVYAESADGLGASSALSSIDKVTGELREKLGEAIAAIDRDSEPLPKVSTGSLDALKAYALGKEKSNEGDIKTALGFYQRAIDIDPEFALARLAAAQTYGSLLDHPKKYAELEKTRTLRDRLAGRERLLLDAEMARTGPIQPQLDRWRQFVDLYPDSFQQRMILAQDGMFYANRFEESLANATACIVPQFTAVGRAHYTKGIVLLGLDRPREALASFAASRKAGYVGQDIYYAYTYAAQRDFARAEKMLRESRPVGVQVADLETAYALALLAVDQGKFADAAKLARQSSAIAVAREPLIEGGEWRVRALTVEVLAEKLTGDAAKRALLAEIANVKANVRHTDQVYSGFSEIMLIDLGYLGAREGDAEVVDNALRAIASSKDVAGYPLLVQMQQVLLAEQSRLAGKPGDAIERLSALAGQPDALIAVHAALLRAARAAKDEKLALSQSQWLVAHRGRGYVEGNAAGLPVALNLADIGLADLQAAEIHKATGDARRASDALRRFTFAWPVELLPTALRRRVAALGG